jgi:co-chaperonin GroES (HSP10)
LRINLKKSELDSFTPNGCYVLIKPYFNDDIEYGTLKLLAAHDEFNYADYASARGMVIKHPAKLSFTYEIKRGTENDMPHETDMELQEGDEVFFSKHASSNLLGESGYDGEQVIICEGYKYILMPYHKIYAVKRGENIFGINGYLLIEPVKHSLNENGVLGLRYDKKEDKNKDWEYLNDGVIRYNAKPNRAYKHDLNYKYGDTDEFNIGDHVLLQSVKEKSADGKYTGKYIYIGAFLEPDEFRKLPYVLWYVPMRQVDGTLTK